MQEEWLGWMQAFTRRCNCYDCQFAIYMVSTFATTNCVIILQTSTGKRSKEITVTPNLLNLLETKGFFITIDGMGCQRKIKTKS
jgi:hypothetical protein